jgi:hypothetical protein
MRQSNFALASRAGLRCIPGASNNDEGHTVMTGTLRKIACGIRGVGIRGDGTVSRNEQVCGGREYGGKRKEGGGRQRKTAEVNGNKPEVIISLLHP